MSLNPLNVVNAAITIVEEGPALLAAIKALSSKATFVTALAAAPQFSKAWTTISADARTVENDAPPVVKNKNSLSQFKALLLLFSVCGKLEAEIAADVANPAIKAELLQNPVIEAELEPLLSTFSSIVAIFA